MSLRRNTKNRLTLYRTCHTCGKSFVTTADSPYMRQVPKDGKRQAIVYFCSQKCYRASYTKDPFTPRKEKVEHRTQEQIREKNKKYYMENRDALLEYHRKYTKANHDQCIEACRFYKKKMKLIEQERRTA